MDWACVFVFLHNTTTECIASLDPGHGMLGPNRHKLYMLRFWETKYCSQTRIEFDFLF